MHYESKPSLYSAYRALSAVVAQLKNYTFWVNTTFELKIITKNDDDDDDDDPSWEAKMS
jgi:hypothetical protein